MGSFQTKAESAPHTLNDNPTNQIEGSSHYFSESSSTNFKGYWFHDENESRLKLFEKIGGSIEMDPKSSMNFYLGIMEETKIQSALIINLFGGLTTIASLPILDLGSPILSVSTKHLSGNLHYLTADDLTAPVMRGLDCIGRPFLAFKFIFKGEKQVASLFANDLKLPLEWMLEGPDSEWFGSCPQLLELDSITYKQLFSYLQSNKN
jgi:hypothetical protein